jgi:hypothetical protein
MSIREMELSWMRILRRRDDAAVGEDGKCVGPWHMMGIAR